MSKKFVNKNFFKCWTPEMAYVLGFFTADGGLTTSVRGGYYLSFYSADRNLLATIKQALRSSHALSKRSNRSGSVYRFQIGSKEMYEDLLRLGLGPNKSSRLKVPKIPKRFIGSFLRGYFDGDGNVWMGTINNSRPRLTSVLQVSFTSSSKGFLRDLLRYLRCLGIRGGSIFEIKNKNCSRLTLSTKDALKLYKIMYNMPHRLCLPRKKSVFESFIKMRV